MLKSGDRRAPAEPWTVDAPSVTDRRAGSELTARKFSSCNAMPCAPPHRPRPGRPLPTRPPRRLAHERPFPRTFSTVQYRTVQCITSHHITSNLRAPYVVTVTVTVTATVIRTNWHDEPRAITFIMAKVHGWMHGGRRSEVASRPGKEARGRRRGRRRSQRQRERTR